MFNSQFQKNIYFRTKKIRADCTNWFPWSKWLHSTTSCKVKNQEKKNTKTMCLGYKSWFMGATFQVSCCSATFQAYQENPAAVLPDDFFAGSTHPDVCLWLWWNIGMSEEHCSRKCCWVDTAVKKQQGDRWNENRENVKKQQWLSTFLWRSDHHGADATLQFMHVHCWGTLLAWPSIMRCSMKTQTLENWLISVKFGKDLPLDRSHF